MLFTSVHEYLIADDREQIAILEGGAGRHYARNGMIRLFGCNTWTAQLIRFQNGHF